MRYVFGFGSLVNDVTHDYKIIGPATITGYQRCWVAAQRGDYSFLSVTEDAQTQIDGLILGVRPAQQAELDHREARYSLTKLQPDQVTTNHPVPDLYLYMADEQAVLAGGEKPILQSYLDCVFQGFQTHFGMQSIPEFIRSTSGWSRGIHNDRAAPIYPRHVETSAKQKASFDRLLTDGS